MVSFYASFVLSIESMLGLGRVKFLLAGFAAVAIAMTLLVSFEASPPRPRLSSLLLRSANSSTITASSNASDEELLALLPPHQAPGIVEEGSAATTPAPLSQKERLIKMHREDEQYEQQDISGNKSNPTGKRPIVDSTAPLETYEILLEKRSKAAARDRLQWLLGSKAASSLARRRDLPELPPVLRYLTKMLANPSGAIDSTIEDQLRDAYTSRLQARTLQGKEAAVPFANLSSPYAESSRLLWHRKTESLGARGSLTEGLGQLFASRPVLGYVSLSRRGDANNSKGPIEAGLLEAHESVAGASDAVLENLTRLVSSLAGSWEVIGRSKPLPVQFEHAGSEGVCIGDDGVAGGGAGTRRLLSPEHYLCLIYLDAKDSVSLGSSKEAADAELFMTQVEEKWFAIVGDNTTSIRTTRRPCGGAAEFYRSTRRMFRNFVPPINLVTCANDETSVADSIVPQLSIYGELVKGAAPNTLKKLKEKKGLDKQWLENIELRNVCLSPDGRIFGNYTPGRPVWGQQYVVKTDGDDLLLYSIKREHNRRSERLRISPLPPNQNRMNDSRGIMSEASGGGRCRVRQTAFLIPMMDPAMNVAHMFFRIASNKLSGGYLTFLRTPPSERLVIFHSALGGDGLSPGNTYRISYQMLNSAWFGIQPATTAKSSDPTANLTLVCFDRIVVLWRTVLMYRTKNKFAAGVINLSPWKFTIPTLKVIRGEFIDCMLGKAAATKEGRSYMTGDPVVVTVVQRRLRRRTLLNLGELLKAFALDLAVGLIAGVQLPRVALRVVDMEALSPNQQAALIHESDIVVGPHGAGMAWTLMLRGKTVYAEFRDGLHSTPEMIVEGIDVPVFVGSEYGKLVYAAGAHYVHKRIFDQIVCYPFEGLSVHQCDYNVSIADFVQQMRVALDVFLHQKEIFKG